MLSKLTFLKTISSTEDLNGKAMFEKTMGSVPLLPMERTVFVKMDSISSNIFPSPKNAFAVSAPSTTIIFSLVCFRRAVVVRFVPGKFFYLMPQGCAFPEAFQQCAVLAQDAAYFHTCHQLFAGLGGAFFSASFCRHSARYSTAFSLCFTRRLRS
jgi:hypothetical protein